MSSIPHFTASEIGFPRINQKGIGGMKRIRRPVGVLAICLALVNFATAETPKRPYVRNPDVVTDPTHKNKLNPKGGEYTEYKLKEPAVREFAVAEARAVTGKGSFVARILRVITGNGGSKIFETITGQDGLTFGIKDFTSDAVLPLLQLIEKNHPGAVKEAFGDQTQVLSNGWLAARKSKINDHGLVALKEIRLGLDRILSDPRYHDEQLERFVKEAVDPTLGVFKGKKYVREFSLAAMIGAANSGGAGGLNRWLSEAEEKTGSKAEETVIPEFVRIYTMRDARDDAQAQATRDLLDKVFKAKAGALPDWSRLGHSARRLRWQSEYFSWADGKRFEELGTFGPK